VRPPWSPYGEEPEDHEAAEDGRADAFVAFWGLVILSRVRRSSYVLAGG